MSTKIVEFSYKNVGVLPTINVGKISTIIVDLLYFLAGENMAYSS